MKTKPRIVLNAPVVIGFAALMFLATFLGILTGGGSTNLFFQTYRSSLASPLTYVRLFTHVLGHSGWSHFMSNAAYILLLGPMLEEKYGSSALVKVILITALVTGLVNNIFFPSVALCGASGVVFAFIILTSFTGYILKRHSGHVDGAYGSSLGGSFAALLIQRRSIHIDHGFIGSSDLDQGNPVIAQIT